MKSEHERLNFRTNTYRVLKQVHPDRGIASLAKESLNLMLHDLGRRVVCKANELVKHSKKRTITGNEIIYGAKLVVPGELFRHAEAEMVKTLTRARNAAGGTRARPINRSAQVGLVFSVSRTENLIRANTQYRVGASASVALSAMLEYISAEMLELSGNAAYANKKTTIHLSHLNQAIQSDVDLKEMFGHMVQVVPHSHIHHELLPTRLQKR